MQVAAPSGLQLIGNGDVFSYTDWNRHVGNGDGPIAACMIGRGALIKPWVRTDLQQMCSSADCTSRVPMEPVL